MMQIFGNNYKKNPDKVAAPSIFECMCKLALTFALSSDFVPQNVDLKDWSKVLKHDTQLVLVHRSKILKLDAINSIPIDSIPLEPVK